MPKFTPAKDANAIALRATKDKATDRNVKLATEVHRLRTKNSELATEVANLTAELDFHKSEGERRHNEVMKKLEALINTFTFQMNTNTHALNVMNAAITNLKVVK